jgi:hypothetical protein
MTNDMCCPIERWVSINGRPLYIMFAEDATYVNGVSVQYQDANMTVYGPGQTYYQEDV